MTRVEVSPSLITPPHTDIRLEGLLSMGGKTMRSRGVMRLMGEFLDFYPQKKIKIGGRGNFRG